MIFTAGVVLGTIYLFVSERLRVDVVAALVMTALLVSGVLTPEQGIAGFSNVATVSVAAMFVMSAGLHKTGVLDRLADLMSRWGRGSAFWSTFLLMLVVGFVSAFMNNTAAVAVFLPVTIELARRCGESPSKMLIPLSFASLFGGACSLVGTSTNILVSSISQRHGLGGFTLFEMAPLGVILAVVGIIYLLIPGRFLLPDNGVMEEVQPADHPFVCELVLEETSSSCGRTLKNAPLTRDLDMDILEVYRGREHFLHPSPHFKLQAGDSLKVRCAVSELVSLTQTYGVAFRKMESSDCTVFTEAVVGPGSPLVGQSLKGFRFREHLPATVVALRRSSTTLHKGLATTILRVGDVLLLAVSPESLAELNSSSAFVLIRELKTSNTRPHLRSLSISILAITLFLIGSGTLPLVVAALLGCVLMLLSGCVTPDEAYEAIDWKVIILIGGMLTLGSAVEASGLDKVLAENLLGRAGAYGPWVTLSVLYLLTSILTEVLSNSATAVLLAPIAIATAQNMNVDPKPFLMAITFAASSSFMTPVGYQTNTLVQGPGRYRFADYLRVGVPLNLLFWVLASILIPRFWSF